jgi:hypothetical protein
MSVLGNILGKIFGRKPAAPAAPASPSANSTAMNQPVNTTVTTVSNEPVDVEAILEQMAANSTQKLNWRTSIVDLMTLLGIDNSLAERRALADELGYTGDKQDTAPMNIWLHKQVIRKLAENGGKVPADLLD